MIPDGTSGAATSIITWQGAVQRIAAQVEQLQLSRQGGQTTGQLMLRQAQVGQVGGSKE
jgi:hypothetical protein